MSPAATTPGAARQGLVADHAVVERQAGALQPAGARRHADADHDDVGVDHRAVGQAHPLHPVAALERLDADAEADVDAVVAVQVGGQRPQVGAQDPLQGHGQGLDHGDLEAPLAAGGGHLGADEAGADHDHPARGGVEVGPDGQAVVERAQHVDPGQAAAAGQVAGRRAGGDDQAVEGDGAPVGQGQTAVAQVQAGGPAARAPSRPRARPTSTGRRPSAAVPGARPAPAWTAAAGRRAAGPRPRR